MQETKPSLDVKALFSVTLLAGEILLSSGAEIYRVEDTIHRLLRLSGIEAAESFVTPTCIIMTLRDPDSDTLTTLRRVTDREHNLARVAQVNKVARALCDNKISLEEASGTLEEIKQSKGYPEWAMMLLLFFLPVCFYMLFGGQDIASGLICLVTGTWLALIRKVMIRTSLVRFFHDLIRAAGVAFLASVMTRIFSADSNTNLIIISSIMPLVPGVSITTAIRDLLHGDYQSGTARGVEAFIIATAVAVGVGAGLFLFRMIP